MTLILCVLTPNRIVWDSEVKEIILSTNSGQIGVLPNHAPIATTVDIGPTIPTTSSSHPKVVEREPEVTKDTVPPTNNRSTKDVQPLVVQVQPQVPNSEPVVTPVSAPMPNLKPSIPYPSRRNERREKVTIKLRNSTKSLKI
ncbi:reverse transcriptase domain-containing protein [Tanacetum coccineum]